MSKSSIYYESRATYAWLPAWAHFFMELGFAVAATPTKPGYRLVVAVIVPTRLLASTLIGTGVVLARADLETECDSYFDDLASLPGGTPLRMRKGNRWYPAQFRGVVTCDSITPGERRLRVQLQGSKDGSLSDLVPPKDVENVIVAADIPRGRLPAKPKGYQIVVNAPFLEKWLGEIDPYLFAFRCQLDCVITGHVRQLRHEITGTPLAVATELGFARGSFQDLLRVKRFLRRSEGFRSEVLPAYGRSIPRELEPAVVIFDGITGLHKYRDAWPHAHRVLVIDRTDHRLSEAASEVYSSYLYRADSDVPLAVCEGLNQPAGVELLCFEEVVR